MFARSRKQAFTLIELLVVISIIALLIAILLPALGAALKSARKAQSSVNLRSLHQACVINGGDNKGFYPGLSSKGEVLKPNEIKFRSTAGSHTGAHIVPRFSIMVATETLAGEHLISPADTDRVPWQPTPQGLSEGVRHKNISYAALDIRTSTAGGSFAQKSWQDNMNASVPIFSARNSDPANRYNFDNSRGQWESDAIWQGSIAWNDGHTTYENQPVVETRLEGQETNQEDHLFDQGNAIVGNYRVGGHVRMIKKNDRTTTGKYGAGSNNVAP